MNKAASSHLSNTRLSPIAFGSRYLSTLNPISLVDASMPAGYQGVAELAGGIVVVQIQGKIAKGEDTNRVAAHLRTCALKAHGGSVFFDLELFTDYESEVRTRYTQATAAATATLANVWIFATSKMVKMGASVAAMMIRQLHIIDREEFQQKLVAAAAPSMAPMVGKS